MDVALSIDTLVSGLGLAKLSLARSHHHIAVSDSPGDQSAPSASVLQISSAVVRSQACRTLPRRLVRRKRRSKRRSLSGDCPDEGGDVGDSGFYGSDPFGGGFGPSGGSGGGDSSGWNFGGPNWEDDSSSRFGSGSGFALDFVYEVICWIALSNCVHFAFKKMLRSLVVDGIGDAAREKVPIRLTTMC
ncbi:ATP-dependent RNA helicase A-like [Rhodamnia argentea]|uniref:ATP-dependent RNA helicase A-like n=1 Tax=Rhodamnia argentea TaxID=178133 RepID=A0A8B8QGC5_9MYRT|nr:ATP-dependent RNA helicase A-like [Rhodamnia argentea]